MQTFMTALSHAVNQPHRTYKALETMTHDTIGVKLFTLMEVDIEHGVAWRSYTNMPEAYPLHGEKPFPQNHWSEIVKGQKKTFVANTITEIQKVFPDHELIASLGCESCLNIPVFINGTLRGTLNCLHKAQHYTPERVAASNQLKPAAALAFLLAQNIRHQGDRKDG